MDWYYAIGAEQKGPVGDAELARLAQEGIVTPQTLVWREGMAGWAPHGGAGNPLPPLPVAGVSAADGVVCAACGKRVPESDSFVLTGSHYCAVCKPQILQRVMEGKSLASPAAEEMRKKHIQHEASVKSIGVLYYLGGVALTLGGIAVIIGGIAGQDKASMIPIGAVLLLFGVGEFWVGTGLRRLRAWARIPTGILSGIGLLGFPLGTLINGYILYLIFSQKGATVFSPEYQQVIRQTPHVKYRTSVVVWIILGLIVLLILGLITAAVVSNH